MSPVSPLTHVVLSGHVLSEKRQSSALISAIYLVFALACASFYSLAMKSDPSQIIAETRDGFIRVECARNVVVTPSR